MPRSHLKRSHVQRPRSSRSSSPCSASRLRWSCSCSGPSRCCGNGIARLPDLRRGRHGGELRLCASCRRARSGCKTAWPHVIFDCDGVLVDSEPLSMRVDVQILAENGVDDERGGGAPALRRQDLRRHARRDAQRIRRELPGRCLGPEGPAPARALRDATCVPCDGVEAALEALGPQHFSVASNSPYERVETALRIARLTRFFGNRITTFEHVARGKPEPDVFIEAARRAGYAPARLHRGRGFGDGGDRRPPRRLPRCWASPAPIRTRRTRRPKLLTAGARQRFQAHGGAAAACVRKNALTLHCNTPIWGLSLLADRNT